MTLTEARPSTVLDAKVPDGPLEDKWDNSVSYTHLTLPTNREV